MEPLIVSCDLVNGFSSSDPWSPALDAILAYWQLREEMGEEEFALSSTNGMGLIVPDHLPLGREQYGDHWWWQCSTPEYETRREWVRYSHRRFDLDAATRYAATGKSGRVMVAAGPYKNYRNRQQIHITRRVTWHCVGDAAEIRRLLRRCSWLGAEVGEGLGRIRTRWEDSRPAPAWNVEGGGDERMARFRRPVPVEFARAHGIHGAPLVWGVRPPGRIQANKTLCVMPP